MAENGMIKYGAQQKKLNEQDMADASTAWKKSRDADLADAFANGKNENIVDSGSLLRPRNFSMWLNSRPEDLQPAYDKNVDEYKKRLEYNNYLHEAQQKAPNSGYSFSPWTMMQPTPPPAMKDGKPVQMQWPAKKP